MCARFWKWFVGDRQQLTEMEGTPMEIVIALTVLGLIAFVGWLMQ
jgi:hypothetical protein